MCMKKMKRSSSFFCLHLSVLTPLLFFADVWAAGHLRLRNKNYDNILLLILFLKISPPIFLYQSINLSSLVQQPKSGRPKPNPEKETSGESFPAMLLTNLNSALKPFASHASRVAATSKPSFTMSTEGDVFYVYVKRQFMSTVISADECLWKFLLEVLCCLGARCMIKAMCKA